MVLRSSLLFSFFFVVFCEHETTPSFTWGLEYSCIWHNNECVKSCPEWMVEVKSNCSETFWVAQKTCEHPESRLVGTVCGFSRCDCPDPMVLDSDTGFCYDEDNCPTNHSVNYELVM